MNGVTQGGYRLVYNVASIVDSEKEFREIIQGFLSIALLSNDRIRLEPDGDPIRGSTLSEIVPPYGLSTGAGTGDGKATGCAPAAF